MMKDSKAPAPQSCEHDKGDHFESGEPPHAVLKASKDFKDCPFCAPKAQADHELMPHFNQSGEDMFECRKCESIAHRKYFEKWPCLPPAQPETKAPQEREVSVAEAYRELLTHIDFGGNIIIRDNSVKASNKMFAVFCEVVRLLAARKERES